MSIEYANTPGNNKLLNETVYLYNKPQIKRLKKEAQIITVVAICILGAGAILCGLKVGGVNGMIASGTTGAALGIIGLFCAGYKLKQRYVISPKLLLEYLLESPEVTRTSGDNSHERRANFRNQLIQNMSSSSYQSFVLFVANKNNIDLNQNQIADFVEVLKIIKEHTPKVGMTWNDAKPYPTTFFEAINVENLRHVFSIRRKSNFSDDDFAGYFANCVQLKE